MLTSLKSGYGEKIFIMDFLVNFGGQVGNMIFMLLTGYFLFEKKTSISDTFKKIKNIGATILYYSIVIFIVLIPFELSKGHKESSLAKQISHTNGSFTFDFFGFNPFQLTDSVWYLRYYVGLLLFILIIGKWLRATDRKKHMILLEILLTLQILNPPIFQTIGLSIDRNFLTFLLMSLLGGYIRRYNPFEYLSKSSTVIPLFLSIVVFIIFDFVQRYSVSIDNLYVYNFNSQSNLLTIIITLLIFILFTKIHIKNNKLINLVASTTIGIYILHDGSRQISQVKYYLIDILFDGNWNLDTLFYGGFVSIFIWFSAGVLLDLLRQRLFGLTVIRKHLI
ncbi:acyltransferase family protein [Enterococcus canis]|nr:acyltransferase family protein [Enterococcus canis]